MTGTLKILDAASDVTIRVILPSRSVQYSISVAAPTEGRQLTRVSWLTRYLDAEKLPSGDLQASVDWTVRGLTTTASLHDYLADAGILCVDKGGIPIPKNANPRYFQIAMTRSLSNARGKSGSPVLKDISKGLEEFYRKVLQDIVPYAPKAPRLTVKEPEAEPETISESIQVGSLPEKGEFAAQTQPPGQTEVGPVQNQTHPASED